MQLPFGDAQELSKRKRTRCAVFLDAMNEVVPWQLVLALIETFYPKAGSQGRQPFGRIICLKPTIKTVIQTFLTGRNRIRDLHTP